MKNARRNAKKLMLTLAGLSLLILVVAGCLKAVPTPPLPLQIQKPTSPILDVLPGPGGRLVEAAMKVGAVTVIFVGEDGEPLRVESLAAYHNDGGICLDRGNTMSLLDYIWRLEEGYK
jgi:hypothetical protein